MHITGRDCDDCGGILKDNMVHFGEGLPKEAYLKGMKSAANSDICLCMGSSLSVKPAINIPISAKRQGAKIAIINV